MIATAIFVLCIFALVAWLQRDLPWRTKRDPFAYLLKHCIHEPRCAVWRECSDLSSRNIANAIHERNEMQKALVGIGYYVEAWEDGDNAAHALGHIRRILEDTEQARDDLAGPDRRVESGGNDG